MRLDPMPRISFHSFKPHLYFYTISRIIKVHIYALTHIEIHEISF